jgi:dethiobiotin synthetase
VRAAFITSTGTDCGKTLVTRALAVALTQRGLDVAALKPIETGCNPDPADALALAEACANPELAHLPGSYRAVPALCPYAVTLETQLPPPNLALLADLIRTQAALRDFTLVEGAGGLLAPTSPTETVADLAVILGAPVILVAPDRLGTLSHTLTAVESAQQRGLIISAVILNATEPTPTAASVSNLAILRDRLACIVTTFPYINGSARALADAGRSVADAVWPRA